MKKLAYFGTLIFAFGFVSSCSKCYSCKGPVEIKSVTASGKDTTWTEYQEDDLCTASSKEIDDKESQGYSCSNS